LIDLAPTVLDLVSVPAPATVEGRSIVAVVNGAAQETAAAYVEAMDANLTRNWAPLTGLVTRTHKLIELPVPELYDLVADPHENANVFTREPDRARTLGALLRGVTADMAARGSSAEKTTLSADARQRLQALGYTASSATRGTRVYTSADDPKTLVGVAEELNRALGAFNAGTADAMTTVRDIIRRHPGFTTARGILAKMQRETGDLAGAIATFEEVVRSGAADQSVMVVLAGYLQEAGAPGKSIALLEAVVAAHPDYADAYNSLGVALSKTGQHDRAREAFRTVLELDPTSASAYENLGVDDISRGDMAGAATNLSRALEIDPRLAGAHNALASVHMRRNQVTEAIAEWEMAVRLDPHPYDALYNLGTVLVSIGRRSEARPTLQRFVDEAPPGRYAPDIARVRRMLAQ
jgi:Tfp pilus assembly protein PilF